VPGGFKAQSFVDISDYIDRKTQSILVHRTQIEVNGGDWWLDGVRGRAMYRGYQINVRYAEAFEVVKEIEVHFGNSRARLAPSQEMSRHDETHSNGVAAEHGRDERPQYGAKDPER
jgi:hypothetical protein